VPRPPALDLDAKVSIIMALLSGATTTARAAREAGVTRQSVGNWKRQFLRGGQHALAEPQAGSASARERRLQGEILRLKAALADAHLQLDALHGGPRTHRPARRVHANSESLRA
jgi:transposase